MGRHFSQDIRDHKHFSDKGKKTLLASSSYAVQVEKAKLNATGVQHFLWHFLTVTSSLQEAVEHRFLTDRLDPWCIK